MIHRKISAIVLKNFRLAGFDQIYFMIDRLEEANRSHQIALCGRERGDRIFPVIRYHWGMILHKYQNFIAGASTILFSIHVLDANRGLGDHVNCLNNIVRGRQNIKSTNRSPLEFCWTNTRRLAHRWVFIARYLIVILITYFIALPLRASVSDGPRWLTRLPGGVGAVFGAGHGSSETVVQILWSDICGNFSWTGMVLREFNELHRLEYVVPYIGFRLVFWWWIWLSKYTSYRRYD